MNKRRLGRSSIFVTEIGLGTNAVGGHNLYDKLDETEGITLVRCAVDLGVNFIDTADVYGLGRSEELIGEALKDYSGEAFIATKGGNEFDSVTKQRIGINNRPEYLRQALENSLRRLRRETVDLYYIHRVDGETPLCDSFGELIRLKEEGKIRAAGLSNVTVEQIQAAMCAGPVDAVQNQYNVLQHEADLEVIPFCEDNGISFVPYGPLAYGLLGGQYKRTSKLTKNDWRRSVPLFVPKNYPRTIKLIDALRKLAKEYEVSLSHLALRWALCHPAVVSTIVGAKTVAQVELNVQADHVRLSDDLLLRVDELVAEFSFDPQP